MRRIRKIKRIAGVIFLLTIFMLFLIVGSVEQGRISITSGTVWIAVNYIVMWIAGRKAGIITL